MDDLGTKYLVILTKSGAVAETLRNLFTASSVKHLKCATLLTPKENHYGIPQIYWDKGFYKVVVEYAPEARREQYELWIA